jgi:pyruvate ferredoxin oxidoreductase beta subunit
MYVANTTYYSTSWVVPWMHTQLGSSGSAGLGTAAALKALMRKGKIKDEPINVIAFCGDGGGRAAAADQLDRDPRVNRPPARFLAGG